MAEAKDLTKKKKPDPELLANLELLQEMEKIRMIQDLHLMDDLMPQKPAPKEKEAKK